VCVYDVLLLAPVCMCAGVCRRVSQSLLQQRHLLASLCMKTSASARRKLYVLSQTILSLLLLAFRMEKRQPHLEHRTMGNR
jgi:hypothetical protein